MPTVPMSMRKLKEIHRIKYGVGLSHRQTGRSLAISPSVVSRYANRAAQLGIKQWPLPTGWDDTKLKHAFLQTQVKMCHMKQQRAALHAVDAAYPGDNI